MIKLLLDITEEIKGVNKMISSISDDYKNIFGRDVNYECAGNRDDDI